MTHTFRYITVLLATVTTCFAGRGQEGKSSFDFLNIPTSTHAYTLGGTNISVIDEDINLVNQNPALMGPESDLQLGLNYMKYVGGINLAGATFGKAAGERGAWAAGIQYYGYGKMKSADETGVITGEFSPKDIVFNGIYAHDITTTLRGGVNAKVIYSSYEQSRPQLLQRRQRPLALAGSTQSGWTNQTLQRHIRTHAVRFADRLYAKPRTCAHTGVGHRS